MIGIIYSYTNIINNKMYIGQTKNESSRKKQHFTDAFVKNKDSLFYRAMRKYGYDNFKYAIIAKIDSEDYETEALFKEELDRLEIHYISEFKSLGEEGYNLTIGGTGVKGLLEETKKKMSDMKKGKPSGNKGSKWKAERYDKPCGTTGKLISTFTKDDVLIKTYESMLIAAEDLGVTSAALTMFLKRTTTGYNERLKVKITRLI